MADLSTLPELLPWPYLVCSREGLVLFANQHVERAIGLKITRDSKIDEIFQELESGRPISSLVKTAARWSAWSGLLELRHPEKGRPTLATKVILQPDPKLPNQVWVIFVDDAQLNGVPLLTPRSSVSLARTLIENSPDFIIFRDLQGRILHTSRSFDDFLALPYRGFLSDLKLKDILDQVTFEQFEKFDEEVTRTGQSMRHAVMHFATHDGRSRLVRVVHERIKGGGGLPAGLLTFASNVTETVDEHNRLRLALDKAEEVAAAKWQFVANVTHEIRNPLNAIQGLCETGLENPGSAYDDILQKIQQCAGELEDTVRDILDFSRLDRGNVTIENIPFNPIRAFEEVAAQFQHQARRKGIELAALCQVDAPQSVMGDPVKFRRIIANLVGNAVKFTQLGHVHAFLEFENRDGRLRAQLQVTDTGIGIPSDRLESIFEPFTQADASTTRRFGGTGLGLTIVRSLAQAMDGFVKVKSEPGSGSTFTATVQLDINPAFTSLPSPNLSQQRLLIVGGDFTIRRWLNHTLTHWGATCIEIENNEAIEGTWNEAAAIGTPFTRALIDLPDDVNPRLPAIPRELTILMTAPELELRRHAQLYKPLTLTALAAKFVAELPRNSDDSSVLRPNAPRRRLRILVAEDNEVNREVAVARLRRAGHEVNAAVDGEAALELWRAKDFDVAILDIQMPIHDGIDVATIIRAEERDRNRRHTFLLALTAMTQETDRARCEIAGFDAYLAKPVRGTELLEKLEVFASQNITINKAETDDFSQAIHQAEAEEAEDLRCAARSYVRHAQDMIHRLEVARDASNFELLSREAHGIKGMLSLMSCASLARLANSIEVDPGQADISVHANELIVGLRNLLETLQSRSDLSPHG